MRAGENDVKAPCRSQSPGTLYAVQPSMNGRPGAKSPNSGDPRIGALIAERYRIERLIGRGGMASVYEATDTALPRRVALKIFRPELADDDDMRRHDSEVGMLASLNHPGLVTLYDAVADERGAAVLVLELVEGTDLRVAMDAGALSQRDVGLIGATIAEALAYSHERGIVHRDVKPANILVPTMGRDHSGTRAKLADFGIARLVDESRMTAIGSVIGTAHYLSPEQALGAEVGAPSDIYSLGLVLIEAIGGARSFPGTGVESAAARLSRDPVLPGGLSADWVALLRSMTERVPSERATAVDAAAALRDLAVASPSGVDQAAEAPDDPLAPTALMPASTFSAVAETALTEVMGGTRVPTDPAPARVSVDAQARTAGRGRVIAIVVGALILAGGGVALGSTLTAQNAPTAPAGDAPADETPTLQSPAYPAVDGTIGDHLEQLQRSVAP